MITQAFSKNIAPENLLSVEKSIGYSSLSIIVYICPMVSTKDAL